jgi:hypothetical protein
MLWRNTSDCRLSPPSHFFFVRKRKKTVLTKNPLANDVTKHIKLIFSPARDIPNCFQTFRQSYLLRFLKVCDKCDFVCDKCDIACDIACDKCDIACDKFNIKKHIKKKSFICANTKIDVTNATNCSAGKGAISPSLLPHFQAGRQKADQVICSTMTSNLLKSDGVEL